eukprot:9579670-Heterocapsa_arctica.AAC.1
MTLLQLQRDGGLPSFISIRDGYKYCNLCSMWATDSHLNAKKHLDKVRWEDSSRSQTAQPAATAASSWETPLPAPASAPTP